MEKKNKAFAYRVPIGDYNYLQCGLGLNFHGKLCVGANLDTFLKMVIKN